MAMSVRKSWSVTIVILAALLICSFSSAAWTFQDPQRTPMSEEERRQALERLTREIRERQGTRTSPAVSAPAPSTPSAAPISAPPPSTMHREGGRVQLNFENAELHDVINQLSTTLGLTPLVIDPEVKGSVIMNSGPISKDDILPLFNLILKNNNAALVQQGGVYQIVPISSALKRGVEIIDEPSSAPQSDSSKPGVKPEVTNPKTNAALRTSGASQAGAKSVLGNQAQGAHTGAPPRLATHVVRVDFVPVKDLIEPVKLFMTEGGVIMPYERLNMLILTDYTDTAQKILQIIRMLDNNYLDPDLVELIKIENNASADVAEDLKKIFGSGAKDSVTGVSFVSLDRLNSIFVIASSHRALGEVRSWVKQLDAESGRSKQTFVYVVENGTASTIAMMLSALYGGDDSSQAEYGDTGNGDREGQNGDARNNGSRNGNGSSFGSRSSFGSSSRSSSQNQNSSLYNSGGDFGNSSFNSLNSGERLGPRLNTNRKITSQILRGGEFSGLQDTVRLVVDDVNNSLILQSTPADYRYISDTIKKMDVLPRQVIIDARVYEVDLTDELRFGVGATLQGRTTGAHNTTGGFDAVTGLLTASTFAFVGNSREIVMSLQALQNKTKVKVLEAPSVLALDGMEAKILVGEEVPYPGATYVGSVSGATTSVDYRPTGNSLIVRPQISASGSVTLDLTQELSSLGALETVGDIKAPSFLTERVETTLSVKDGETVAIAGLIRDSNEQGRAGVPFLSEIPLVGALFGHTLNKGRRSELIILITPHVIRTPEKMAEKTQEIRDSLRHVRKFADEKEEELIDDREEARQDRVKEAQKAVKATKKDRQNKDTDKKNKKNGDDDSKKDKEQREEAKKEGMKEEKGAAPDSAPTTPSEPPLAVKEEKEKVQPAAAIVAPVGAKAPEAVTTPAADPAPVSISDSAKEEQPKSRRKRPQ